MTADDMEDDEPERGGGSGDSDMESVIARARKIATALEINPRTLDGLFARSQFQSLGREAWEQELRFATGMDRALHRALKTTPVGMLGPVDEAVSQAATEKLRSPTGTLLLVYHGGFAALGRALFSDWFPDGVRISAKGDYKAKDGAYALFAARRALLDGKNVLISPEGRFGKARGTVPIMGMDCSVGDGAPFLAHSTQCRTVWFGLIRDNDRFATLLVEGPRASREEPFPAFRERFFGFYAAQIEKAFAGDPRSLSLSRNWAGLLEGESPGSKRERRRQAKRAG
jgi:hypothetical protein